MRLDLPADDHQGLVFDLHGHAPDVVPRSVRRLAGAFAPLDPAMSFEEIAPAGVTATVASAVGDPLATRWQRALDPWRAVQTQLSGIARQASVAELTLVRSSRDLEGIRAGRTAGIVMGLEGADVLGADLGRIDHLHRMGVRIVGLVHYSDNDLGTIGTSVLGRARSAAVRRGRRRAGLTEIGAAAVRRLNRRGVIVDVAHADAETTRGVCEVTSAPVVASHTGVAALDDLPRYVSDAEIVAIAGTGGLIGLWPFHLRGRGMRTSADFARQAAHVADLVGPEHLCFGSDVNGGPATLEGYRGLTDHAVLRRGLHDAGFSDDECAAVMGGNARRVFDAVCGAGGVDDAVDPVPAP